MSLPAPLLSRWFWEKLLRGGISVRASVGGLNDAVARARERIELGGSVEAPSLPGKMALAMYEAENLMPPRAVSEFMWPVSLSR